MIEQVTNLQGIGFENPAVLAAAAAGPLVVGAEYLRHVRGNPNEQAPNFSNTEGLQNIINTTPNRRTGWGTRAKIGLGVIAVGALSIWGAKPTTETLVPNPDAQVVVVEDHSFAMTLTDDMEGGQSRHEAIRSAVIEAIAESPSNLKIGYVDFGDQVRAQAPTSDRRSILKSLQGVPKDQNGNNITGAFQRATEMFPKTEDGSQNNVVVISDGIINSSSQLAEQLKAAKKANIEVDVVVPGTKTGTYKTDKYSDDKDAAIQPEVFTPVGEPNIHIVTSQSAAKESLESALKDTAYSKEKKPYAPAGWLMVASSAAAFALLLSEGAKRLAINRTNRHK